MIAKIHHSLVYQYSEPVYLEPHVLYVYPRKSSLLSIKEFDLSISPTPVQISKNLDPEGNIQNILFFKDPTAHLNIEINAVVETTEFNPFDFVYFPFDSKRLPMRYSDAYLKTLAPYLGLDGVTPVIEQTARHLASQVQWSTSEFLRDVNSFIFSIS
jgi:transglutaminase-like putative cysteine protease